MTKILLIDIETSPIVGYTWGTYDVNVLQVIEPVKIICCAWRWLGEKRIHVRALPDFEGYAGGIVDDGKLVTELWALLDDADVVVAHNGDSFDIKILNTRFIAHKLTAPSYYKSIDTLKAARKYFRFSTNKLDDLGGYLNEGHKGPTGGFSTWVSCMAGDTKAWATMRKYNIQDVELLERVYLRLRPFIGNHPDLNIFDDTRSSLAACGACQSADVVKRGFLVTKAGRYQRYQCNDCGSWSSGKYERSGVKSKDD